MDLFTNNKVKPICKNVYRPPGVGDDLTLGGCLYQGEYKKNKLISVCTDISLLYIYVWCDVCIMCKNDIWHEYAKIPRHTSQNSIAAGNLE